MAAWVKGAAVELDAALHAASDLLGSARAPIVTGLCADVAAIRAAYRLAETLGASVDPVAAGSLYAELGPLSVSGSMTTTASEARGRADIVLVLGARAWDDEGVAAITGSHPVRGRTAGAERVVLSLGGPPERDVSAARNVTLAVALGHLRAHAKGHLADDAAYTELAGKLAGARYGAVIYDPAELGELGVEMALGLVRDLNETTRVFALSIADAFQGRSTQQLAAWTTGQPPRMGFGRGQPEHDPWRFDAARQIAAGEADAALWLASLPAPRPDWLGALPTIAIVGQGSPEARSDAAEIVIEAGVPGQTVGGAIWNAERGAIAFAEPANAADAAPAAGALLARIRDHVIEGRA